jgi:hypothetical protein
MKTLKQIREEYEEHLVSQVESLPEKMMLEDQMKNTLPSYKDMPTLLVFRRVSYRSYPRGQVVALYYSKTVGKYLSIPFGPGGNLNLSESTIIEEDQLDEVLPIIGAVAGAVGRSALGSAIKKGAKALLRKGLKSALGGSSDTKDTPSQTTVSPSVDRRHLDEPHAKVSSSWKTKPDSDPVYQSKLKQASIKENKITDIRKMINEGTESIDLSINGRSVTLNTSMAKRILEVYDSVNTKNKKIVESMLNEDLESFKKLLNFSIRN